MYIAEETIELVADKYLGTTYDHDDAVRFAFTALEKGYDIRLADGTIVDESKEFPISEEQWGELLNATFSA